MRHRQAYVRGTLAGAVDAASVSALSRALATEPVEWVLTAWGARRGTNVRAISAGSDATRLEEGRDALPHTGETPVPHPHSDAIGQITLTESASASSALARRNVRSLLALHADAAAIEAGLHAALNDAPREAEDALEDAGLLLNLRHSVYAAEDAELAVRGRALVIRDAAEPTVSLSRRELRERGGEYFCKEALACLVSLEVESVRLSPSAVWPVAWQVEPGGLMEPDTAHALLHKGQWRGQRQAVFNKRFCITCGRCFIHCPDNAIIHAMFDPQDEQTTGVLGIDVDRCTACGICASVCPPNRDGYKAIVMWPIESQPREEDHHVG